MKMFSFYSSPYTYWFRFGRWGPGILVLTKEAPLFGESEILGRKLKFLCYRVFWLHRIGIENYGSKQ